GLYENDFFTELISKMLLKISKDNEKKNVLIVDDLDRVDPEHIFRLLNVFAAHFDVDDKKENKFGFDHVIFVFDISNIRKIFQNKYGQGVDFSGYIDKFYSREVFYFDNSEAIKETLRIVISRITIKGIDNDLFSFQYKTSAGNHVYLVLLAMINNHCINLRSLLRLLDQEYEVKRDTVSIFSKNDFNLVRNYSIILALNFLKALFGNSDGLINAIKKLSEVSDAVTTHYNGLGGDYAIGALLLIIDHNNHSLMVGEYEYIDQELNVHYSYRIEFNGLGGQEVSAKVLSAHDLTNGTQKVKELLFFKLLYKAAIVLRNNEDL
ncbi:MAG: P-loop NTPase fold protein, partial [Bacteroidota bacterium]